MYLDSNILSKNSHCIACQTKVNQALYSLQLKYLP